ncbi:MAG: hypothetical protein H7Y86_01000 [Rhizobacter sp.]|nr:hypothetical protein [Ferruginibacter sp.]
MAKVIFFIYPGIEFIGYLLRQWISQAGLLGGNPFSEMLHKTIHANGKISRI